MIINLRLRPLHQRVLGSYRIYRAAGLPRLRALRLAWFIATANWRT